MSWKKKRSKTKRRKEKGCIDVGIRMQRKKHWIHVKEILYINYVFLSKKTIYKGIMIKTKT